MGQLSAAKGQNMSNQQVIHLLLIVFFVVIQLGCKHEIKQKEQEGTLSFEMAVPSAPPTLKSASEEPPAVIYRSTDLGKTWSSFAKGIPEEATLSGIKQDGNKVYVATDYHGIFSSTDGQNNWIPLKSNQLKHLDINCIEADDHKLVIGTLKNGIFVSNDEGTNWTQAKIANDKMPIRAFIKSQGDLYAGTDSGIFRSTDMGDTWLHVFGKVQILGFTALNNKLYAASQNGVLLCNVHPSDWESIYEGDALHDIGNDGEYIYAMTIGQQLLKTNNDGKQWDNAQNGILQPANFYTNELKHVGQDIFSAQWIGIYHSSNHGSSWNKLSGLPDSTAFSTLEITDYGIIAGISIR